MTTSTEPFISIPLNKLVPWKGNVRKTNRADRIEELAADIAAHGLLNPLLIRKASRGKFGVVAGSRRHRALSLLAERGQVESDHPVACHPLSASADAAEISLAENVSQAPMHPADQFEAFRDLIDAGRTLEDIATRFGITEAAVKKRLTLGRVSPLVLKAYRKADLTLEQVEAFAVTDDEKAQERVLGEFKHWNGPVSPYSIRRMLTKNDTAATDRRAQFVGLAAYEEAGGAVRRDLFSEGDEGVFILDVELLDRLAGEKLNETAEAVRAEGWKWVETVPQFDHSARSQFRRLHPEPLPLSAEAEAEQSRLADEYEELFNGMEEGDEEASERLDAIQARMEELSNTGAEFTPETLALAGAVVTINSEGQAEIVRGLARPEDMPTETAVAMEGETSGDTALQPKPPFSAALVESLTAIRSVSISAALIEQPDIALAALTHALAADLFAHASRASCLQITARQLYGREACSAKDAMEAAHAAWSETLPDEEAALWDWCLTQDRDTLLRLLAFCAASAIDGVQRKGDRSDSPRLAHSNALAAALKLDLTRWFTPTAENYFRRVGRAQILADLEEARQAPAPRSWRKLPKSGLASLAEREIGAGWLPQPLRLT